MKEEITMGFNLWITSVKIKIFVSLAKIADKLWNWAMKKAKETLDYGDYLLCRFK